MEAKEIDPLTVPQQCHLARLAAIPGTFDEEAAQAVLESTQLDCVDVLQQLEDSLAVRRIENSRYRVDSEYKSWLMHSEKLAAEYRKGGTLSHRHYSEKLQQATALMETDGNKALRVMRVERVNFVDVMDRLQQVKFPTSGEQMWYHLAAELVMVSEERLAYYSSWKEVAKVNENHQLHADLCCHKARHLLDMGYPKDTVMPLLEESRRILKTLPEQTSPSVELSYATLHYHSCYVAIYFLHFRSGKEAHHERLNYVDTMQKCLDLREKHLGNHTLTVRALNLAGLITHSVAAPPLVHVKVSDAMDNFNSAVDMCNRLTTTGEHVDMSIVSSNMGSCMYEAKMYKRALHYFRKSLDQERALGTYGTKTTCTTLKNMATTYMALKQHTDAIKTGNEAMVSCSRLHGVHPRTAIMLQFMGTMHAAIGNHDMALLFFDGALEMEEALDCQGKAPSPDWCHLQDRFERALELTTDEWLTEKYTSSLARFDKINRAVRDAEEAAKADDRRAVRGPEHPFHSMGLMAETVPEYLRKKWYVVYTDNIRTKRAPKTAAKKRKPRKPPTETKKKTSTVVSRKRRATSGTAAAAVKKDKTASGINKKDPTVNTTANGWFSWSWSPLSWT